LVQGGGMLGLTAAAVAATEGARAVIVCEPNPERAALAGRFGATHTVTGDVSLPAMQETVASASEGEGADVALELSGSTASVETGLEVLAVGGRYGWVGSVFPAAAVPVTAESVVRQLLTIHGVHNYHPRDLAAALRFLARPGRRFPFADLVSPVFPLAEAEAA